MQKLLTLLVHVRKINFCKKSFCIFILVDKSFDLYAYNSLTSNFYDLSLRKMQNFNFQTHKFIHFKIPLIFHLIYDKQFGTCPKIIFVL